MPGGVVLRGWARGASGDTAEGISWIEGGIRDYQATGAALRLPYFLSLKAEALHLADRPVEALEAIKEAEVIAERSEGRWWCAEMHRLRGVFLAALGADETQIEASFCAAINIAREHKSISLEKRAEGTYAEYRRQEASASGGHVFRLPLVNTSDVVRVKETVTVTPWFEDDPIEIQAGRRGTIVTQLAPIRRALSSTKNTGKPSSGSRRKSSHVERPKRVTEDLVRDSLVEPLSDRPERHRPAGSPIWFGHRGARTMIMHLIRDQIEDHKCQLNEKFAF